MTVIYLPTTAPDVGLPVQSYLARPQNFATGEGAITIERVSNMSGSDSWAIRCRGECLNKSGAWQHEPLPSSRDDKFIANCRFTTPEEAKACLDAALVLEK